MTGILKTESFIYTCNRSVSCEKSLGAKLCLLSITVGSSFFTSDPPLCIFHYVIFFSAGTRSEEVTWCWQEERRVAISKGLYLQFWWWQVQCDCVISLLYFGYTPLGYSMRCSRCIRRHSGLSSSWGLWGEERLLLLLAGLCPLLHLCMMQSRWFGGHKWVVVREGDAEVFHLLYHAR
jgi:hypothetical protein